MLFIVNMTVNLVKLGLIIDALKDLQRAITGLGDETHWAGSALDYAIFVEKGTHAPKQSGDGQFVERIREWAKDKAIPAGAAINTILEEGTEPHPYRRPALEKAANQFDLVKGVQHGGNVSRVSVEPQAFIGEEGERAIDEIAEFVVKEMRSNFGTEEGPRSDTGDLRDSITHASSLTQFVNQSRQAKSQQ
jgi:hypothetical protein